MKHPVSVPYEVQQRAWESAYMLLEEFSDRLSLEQRILCVLVDRSGPDSVGWEYAARLFSLWRDLVEVRV